MLTSAEPATDAQIAFLRKHGVEPPLPLSRLDARELIRKCESHEPLRVLLARRVREAGAQAERPEELAEAQGRRAEFWIDTCTGTACVGGVDEVHDLYRMHGCLYCTPTVDQVDSVLAALDQASPGWEGAHPELFFETLGLNFPELRRR